MHLELAMDLATVASWIWNYGVMFLLVMTHVVFIHELGHFLVARWYGVKVSEFSIGFGPEIFGFNDKYGTRWRFAWIPLGGYVKFVDDANAASQPPADGAKKAVENEGAFHSKPVAHRAAVVAAGPMANFLLAIALYAALNMTYGVRTMPAYVDKVVAGAPAQRAGFQAGDKNITGESEPIEKFDDLQRIVGCNAGRELSIVVERAGQPVSLKVTPNIDEQRDALGRTFRRGLIGIQRSISPDQIQTRYVGPFEAVWLGVPDHW